MNELKRVHEGENLFPTRRGAPRAGQGKRQNAAPAPAPGQRPCQGVLRVLGQVGVVDVGDLRVGFQPGGEGEGVFTLLAHPQGQGFEAAQGEPRLKWPQTAPDKFVECVHFFVQGGVGDDHARHHIAVPGQVFGRAVDDHVHAVLEGGTQVGGAEGVVHQEKCAVGVRESGEFGQVGNFEEGVGDRLSEEDGGGVGGEGGADFVQVEDVYPMHGDAQFGEELVEQGKRRAIYIRRGDDVAPRPDTRREQGHMDGRHAGRERVGGFSAFEIGDGGFKGVNGGVVVAGGVDEAGLLVAQHRVEVVGVGEGVANGGVNGGDDGGAARVGEVFAGVDGTGGQVDGEGGKRMDFHVVVGRMGRNNQSSFTKVIQVELG